MKAYLANNFDLNIKKDWIKLEQNSYCTPFQSFEWHINWFEYIGKKLEYSPVLISIKDENQIIGIFPFCYKKDKFSKKIIWNGGLQTDYNLPLIHKNYYNELNILYIWKIVKKILPNYDILYLEKQPEFILEIENIFLKTQKKIKQINSSRVIFNNTWQTYYKNLSLKLKNDNRRQINRLQKFGKINFFVCNDNKEKKILIETMIKQKSQRYKSTNSWDMFSESYNKKFYFEISKKLNLLGKIHCSGIRLNETIIAAHVGIFNQKCFYYILPSFDIHNYGKFSPGKILLEKLLFWTFENNIKIFDFTGGNEIYKDLWCNDKFNLYESFEAQTIRGRIIIIFINLKKIFRRIPFLKTIYYKLKNIK